MTTRADSELRVGLGDRSYSILVGTGLLAEAGREVATLLPSARITVVTNPTVAALFLKRVTDSLDQAGFHA